MQIIKSSRWFIFVLGYLIVSAEEPPSSHQPSLPRRFTCGLWSVLTWAEAKTAPILRHTDRQPECLGSGDMNWKCPKGVSPHTALD